MTNRGVWAVSRLRRLKELDIRSCRLVTDDGFRMAALTGRFARLESLGVQDCQRITDEGVARICMAMRSLVRVNISFCISVTDTGLKSVATLPRLEELNMRSCDNVSDIGVGFLASDCGGHGLKRLDASFCPNVTNTSALHMAAGMPKLKTLSLAGCSLDDDGLTRIAKELKCLEMLNIGQCRKLTDAGLKVVANELSGSLQRIDLYGCPGITSSGLELLTKMPKIKLLNRKLYLATSFGRRSD